MNTEDQQEINFNIVKVINNDGLPIRAIEMIDYWKGLTFSYSDVKIIEVPDEPHAVLEFKINIHHGQTPEDYVYFKHIAGQILEHIMYNGVNIDE